MLVRVFLFLQGRISMLPLSLLCLCHVLTDLTSSQRFAGVQYQVENQLAEKITVHVAVSGGRWKGTEAKFCQVGLVD